jgi:alpha-mannosidase
MTLTSAQRIQRLRARTDELSCWRDRDHLDLSYWSFAGAPLALGLPWPDRGGVQRFEHPHVAVSDAWPLDETELELDVGGEGLLTLHYQSGHERFGLDRYHRRFPLRERRFSVELDAVARLPFGVPYPEARLARARLVWVDTPLEGLIRLLELVRETAEALRDHEVVPPLLERAERAIASLDWPSRTPDVLARIQHTELVTRLWSAPEGLERHPPALTDEQRGVVLEAYERLVGELRALQQRYPPQGALLLSGHAHIDLAWLWPLDETKRKLRRTSASMLALLRRHPGFTFNQSHAQYYDWLEADDPEMLGAIVELAARGSWEPLGGMWVESDTLMPTGESLARQLLYGQRAFERRFGRPNRIGWLPDCFGFSPALPQLYALAGIDAFFTTKTNWNETNRFPHDLFWWEGLDGTRLLTHTFFNEHGGYNGVFSPATTLGVWRHYRGKHRHPEGLLTLGYGDGGGGTTSEMLLRQRAAEPLPVLPRTRFGRVEDYFAELHQSARRERLPVWSGEIYLELHRGTLTSQGRTKRLHRRAERALLAAEVTGSLAALRGGPLPASLEPAWRELLKNQFHDILPGSSIGEVYARAERELSDVIATADAETRAALERLAANEPGGAETGLLVVNTELCERPLRLQLTGDLADAVPGAQRTPGCAVVAADASVPGLSACWHGSFTAPAGLSVSERRLENALLRVDVGDDGTLSSVVDKRAEREVLAGRGNQLWAYVDKPREWDAWDVDVDYRDQGVELTDLHSLEVIEHGPHRAALRIVRRFRDSVLTQELRLWANSPRLDVATTCTWRERHWLLKARFPLAVRAETATFEAAFGVVRRPTHANTPWDAARFEVAGHRFADLSEPGYGVALLNDGRYGHHALPSELGLTLLRSPTYPDPYADEGEHAFTYALLPHAGDWHAGGVLAEAEDLNQPLLATPAPGVNGAPWQPLRIDGAAVALGALKPAEEGEGLVLRVFEPQGARGPLRVKPPPGWRLAGPLDLLERPQPGEHEQIGPFQVRTLLLQRA